MFICWWNEVTKYKRLKKYNLKWVCLSLNNMKQQKLWKGCQYMFVEQGFDCFKTDIFIVLIADTLKIMKWMWSTSALRRITVCIWFSNKGLMFVLVMERFRELECYFIFIKMYVHSTVVE